MDTQALAFGSPGQRLASHRVVVDEPVLADVPPDLPAPGALPEPIGPIDVPEPGILEPPEPILVDVPEPGPAEVPEPTPA